MDPESSDTQIPITSLKKRILFSTAFILLSLIVALLIAEVFVRLFTKPVYPILRTDEKVGTIHKPNVQEYLWNEESGKEQFIITNSLGYIGEQEPSEPKNGLRIALIGDSFTEGLQVDSYETFPYILENTLTTTLGSTTPVTVYNYGVGGTATFLQILRYREHIRPYDMDVVGLIFGQNDFEDNMNKIHFDIDNYEGNSERSVGLKQVLLKFALPKFIFKQLMSEVWFLKLLNAFGLYELNERTLTKVSEGPLALMEDPQYYSFTFDLIRKMKKEVEADGATFFVFFNTIIKTDTSESSYASYQALKSFLEEENIRYIETGIDLEKPHGREGHCLTFKCSGHLNSYGHRAYAQILYPPLLEMLCEQNELACIKK